MTRRPILVGVAFLAVVVTATGCSTGGTSAPPPVLRGPAAAVQTALAEHDTPTALGPLPGSVQAPAGPSVYSVASSCDAARAAFRASGGPEPAGSKLSDGPNGMLLVTTVYGDQEGIVFEPVTANSCQYSLDPDPVVLVGSGPLLPAGAYWGRVGCAAEYDTPSQGQEAAVFSAGGKDWAIYVAPPQDADGTTAPAADSYQAVLVPGGLAALKAAEKSGDDLATDTYPVTVSDTGDGGIAAALGGAGQGQVITFTCTTDLDRVMNLQG